MPYRHRKPYPLLLSILIVVGTSIAACSSSRPKMTVLGVRAPQYQAYQARTMRVMVEVLNPTGRALHLKRLEYHLVAQDWFDSTGTVTVGRVVPAGASTVVAIAVSVDTEEEVKLQGVPYTLEAKLVASADKTERSWTLQARGKLAKSQQNNSVKFAKERNQKPQ